MGLEVGMGKYVSQEDSEGGDRRSCFFGSSTLMLSIGLQVTADVGNHLTGLEMSAHHGGMPSGAV